MSLSDAVLITGGSLVLVTVVLALIFRASYGGVLVDRQRMWREHEERMTELRARILEMHQRTGELRERQSQGLDRTEQIQERWERLISRIESLIERICLGI